LLFSNVQFELKIKLNDKLYLKDPMESELGRLIIREALPLLNELGFEDFTFKKLAKSINTTEASVYRYFENKHKLLVYYLAWYWSLMQYRIDFSLQNINNTELKLKKIIKLLINPTQNNNNFQLLDENLLGKIIVEEGSKSFLTKNVEVENKDKLFKPYKDICELFSGLIKQYNPKYKYCHSLATTILEISHSHRFHAHYLPSLTDVKHGDEKKLTDFLNHILFSSIKK
jgi:AcrR family transcriptional regulator